jgi:hypothetical protein
MPHDYKRVLRERAEDQQRIALAAANGKVSASRPLDAAEPGDTRYRARETLADARTPGSASVPEPASETGA